MIYNTFKFIDIKQHILKRKEKFCPLRYYEEKVKAGTGVL
jgi:hypothetical protein